MKNPAPYLRKKIFALLDGNVTYGGNPIPTREGEITTIASHFIIIGGYSDTGMAVKHSILKSAYQDVEIVTIKNDPTAKDADAIAEIVMNIISPTLMSSTLSGIEFSVTFEAPPSLLPIREESIEGTSVFRRVLRYRLLIEDLT